MYPPHVPSTAYAGLTAGHPLAPALTRLLECVAADPSLTGAAAPPGARVGVRRDLRVDLDPRRHGEIARFIWCAQWREPGAAGGLRARTLLYDRGREPRTYDFPHDPHLPAAAAPGGPLGGRDVEVLRYVPRQRITFRSGAAAVGKIKRPKSLARSYARVEAAFAAASARAAGTRAAFRVPEPRGLDAARGAYYQELMPGPPVDQLLAPANAEALMRALGAAHRELHRLPAAGLPVRDPEELVAIAREDAAWVAFAFPDHAAALGGVEGWLERALAAPGDDDLCFCHGDLAIDQVLLDDGVFSVVDFDDAARGDPHADLGTMLAALPFDAPQLYAGPDPVAERAVAAYLDGYREHAGGALDERRLRAHRVRADLGLLASRLRKGQAGPEEVAGAVARLQAGAAGG